MITVCDNAKESCPFFPAITKRMHWPFQDAPRSYEGTEQERLAAFRIIRDQMKARFTSELATGVFSLMPGALRTS